MYVRILLEPHAETVLIREVCFISEVSFKRGSTVYIYVMYTYVRAHVLRLGTVFRMKMKSMKRP